MATTKHKPSPVKKTDYQPPVKDTTDRLPSLPPEGVPTKMVRVAATQKGFDGWRTREEGEIFDQAFPLDEDGDPKLWEWVVPAEQYRPSTFDLPGTTLSSRNPIRGGATGTTQL